MKIILEYDSQDFEEKAEAKVAMCATEYSNFPEEVWNVVFRPFYKHGYDNPILDADDEVTSKVIDALADRFTEMKQRFYESLE